MKEIIKTIEEMIEVDFCMYCGRKLKKLEGENTKVCIGLCAIYRFISIGDDVPDIAKELLKITLPKVDKKLYDEFHHCRNGMIS
jgi:DNA gyrase inhibitor GyrI